MTAAQARLFNELRVLYGIHICYFAATHQNVDTYRFYATRKGECIWNPVTRKPPEKDEKLGKIIGYTMYPSFEEGLMIALFEAKKFRTPNYLLKERPTPETEVGQ